MKSKISKSTPVTLTTENISNLTHEHDPDLVLSAVEKGKVTLDKSSHKATDKGLVFRLMTLGEFRNGGLLATAIPDEYKTFGIDLMRKFQQEYSCITPSEQATAELMALSFVRILNLEARMTRAFSYSGQPLGQNCLAILSKELDRANRHYLAALQTLRMLKQPVMNINVKANVANVANQQIVKNENVIGSK